MTKQLSDCCKAEIKLTGEPRPNAFTCKKCGRIIGTPLTKPITEWRKRLEELKYRTEIGAFGTKNRSELLLRIDELGSGFESELLNLLDQVQEVIGSADKLHWQDLEDQYGMDLEFAVRNILREQRTKLSVLEKAIKGE